MRSISVDEEWDGDRKTEAVTCTTVPLLTVVDLLNLRLPDRRNVPPRMFESSRTTSPPSWPDRLLNSLSSATGCTWGQQKTPSVRVPADFRAGTMLQRRELDSSWDRVSQYKHNSFLGAKCGWTKSSHAPFDKKDIFIVWQEYY
jgi:hypothetical protein